MEKYSRKINVVGKNIYVDFVGLDDDIYEKLKKNRFTKVNKPTTLLTLRSILMESTYQGKGKYENKFAHVFKKDHKTIYLNEELTRFIYAKEDYTNKLNKDVIKIGNNTYKKVNLFLSNHADTRIKERFFITEDKLKKEFCIRIIEQGQYHGLQYDKDLDKEAHLYSKNGIIILIDKDKPEIVTIYEGDIGYYETAKNEITPIIKSKLNGARRKYQSLQKQITFSALDIQEEIIQLKRRLLKTRSEATRLACQARINALEEQLILLEEDKKKAKQKVKDYQYLYACVN